jgi:hypothetical protein
LGGGGPLQKAEVSQSPLYDMKLTPHQQRETIRRSDVDGETLRSIGRSYNVSPQTISRLTA